MHVLFLLTQDLESPSGLGRYFPLARELSHMGHKVTIAALHSNYTSLHQHHYFKEGVEVFYVAQMHVLKQADQKQYFSNVQLIYHALRATLALANVALKVPADIVHVGKPHPMNSFAGLASKSIHKKILLVDCDDFEAGSSRFSHRWQKQIVSIFERQVPRFSAVVTTNTQFMQDKLISWGIPASRVCYIPNGVETQRMILPEPGELDALKAELGLAGKKIIAYIGSLSLPSHPVDLLIEAFGIVHASIPEAGLVLVGGGEDYETLKGLVRRLGLESAVRFCGRVPQDRVIHYYHIAHVSVDPVHDNDAARGRSPLKLFESWAFGIPFVTADVGDRRLLLGDPPAGLLARPGDPNSLADCLEKILSNPALGVELQKRGLERVQEFTIDKLAQRLAGAYEQALVATIGNRG